jgi:hypothetical protein
MRRGHLLDTNHMSAAIRQVSPVRDRIDQAHRAGSRFATCVPVLCELEVGIQQTADPDAYRRRLRHLLGIVRVWPRTSRWPGFTAKSITSYAVKAAFSPWLTESLQPWPGFIRATGKNVGASL